MSDATHTPDLLVLYADHIRQMEALAERLAAKVFPGHVNYISKADAAAWLERLVQEGRAAIAKATN